MSSRNGDFPVSLREWRRKRIVLIHMKKLTNANNISISARFYFHIDGFVTICFDLYATDRRGYSENKNMHEIQLLFFFQSLRSLHF